MASGSFVRVLLLLVLTPCSQALELQQQIERSVKDYVSEHWQDSGQDDSAIHKKLTLTPIDSRRKLAPCQSSLQVKPHKPLRLGQQNIRVSCVEPLWSLYVSVKIQSFQWVVVSKKPLKRRQVMTESQLQLKNRDVSQLRQGYFTELEQLVGKTIKRGVSPLSPITPAMVEETDAVKKGDSIMIQVQKGHLRVNMKGVALNNGKPGHQIAVKNLSSQKTIWARVISQGLVVIDW